MRILVLTPQPFSQEQGTPITTKLLLQVLGQVGHELNVLAAYEGEYPALPGVKVHRIPAPFWAKGVKPGFYGSKLPALLPRHGGQGLASAKRRRLRSDARRRGGAAFMAQGLRPV